MINSEASNHIENIKKFTLNVRKNIRNIKPCDNYAYKHSKETFVKKISIFFKKNTESIVMKIKAREFVPPIIDRVFLFLNRIFIEFCFATISNPPPLLCTFCSLH